LTAHDKGTGKVIYPVVVVEVNGIKCRALFDTGAGSSYASSAILDHLRIRLLREEFKRVEMMLGSVNKAIGVYGVTINSLDGNFRKWIVGLCYHLKTQNTLKLSKSTPTLQAYR